MAPFRSRSSWPTSSSRLIALAAPLVFIAIVPSRLSRTRSNSLTRWRASWSALKKGAAVRPRRRDRPATASNCTACAGNDGAHYRRGVNSLLFSPMFPVVHNTSNLLRLIPGSLDDYILRTMGKTQTKTIAEGVIPFIAKEGAGPVQGAPYHDSTYSTAPVDYSASY
jgi:hypothetical protein